MATFYNINYGPIPEKRNHSTYWIVNHCNPFKLVNSVSVILLKTLNWRIYHNYNPFKLGQLDVILVISIIVHLWFEVSQMIFKISSLDLPNLQSIRLGNYSFYGSSITIIESTEWMCLKWKCRSIVSRIIKTGKTGVEWICWW